MICFILVLNVNIILNIKMSKQETSFWIISIVVQCFARQQYFLSIFQYFLLLTLFLCIQMNEMFQLQFFQLLSNIKSV